MRTMMALAVGLCCIQPVAALATTFAIDSSQSYISFETPAWQRGLPWGFILPGEDGSEVVTVAGYEWLSVTQTKRFDLSGKLDIRITTDASLDGPHISIDPTLLVSLAPAELGFQLPRFVSIDSATGELNWTNACTSSSSLPTWCYSPTWGEWMTGTLSGGNLKIDGESQGFLPPIFESVSGGMEAPPLPEYSLAELGYSYHIVATIPEPSSALLMTAGLATILLRRLRRDRVSS